MGPVPAFGEHTEAIRAEFGAMVPEGTQPDQPA
jgi:hypothetical protein